MAYTQASRDLRERALAALDAGRSVGEVAAVIGMDPSTVRRWRRLRDRTGRSGPLPHPGPPPRLDAAGLEALRADVLAHPDDTLAQRQARWLERTGVRLGLSTLSRALRRLAITFKQRP
jgi:transposase